MHMLYVRLEVIFPVEAAWTGEAGKPCLVVNAGQMALKMVPSGKVSIAELTEGFGKGSSHLLSEKNQNKNNIRCSKRHLISNI